MLDLVTLLALFDPAGIMARFLEADAMTVYMLVFVFMVVESLVCAFSLGGDSASGRLSCVYEP